MEKYRKEAEKRLSGTQHPDAFAREALEKAEFASHERELFFNRVVADILIDYFMNWIRTDPHEVKTREFIYNSALGLGDVKARMIQYETYGKNIPVMKDQDAPED